MPTKIDEIVDGIYRIATIEPEIEITFNQFLIDDERPTLIHTGVHQVYDDVRRAIAEVLDPASLAYVLLLHFESDECGGMQRFVDQAPGSELVCSDMSVAIGLSGWDFSGPVRGMKEGEALELGQHRLRFLETPHVHHWDSMMVFEESTRSLFPSDLFIQPGDQPPVVREDITEAMIGFYRAIGIFAHEKPVRDVVDRVEALDPEWIHAMHGGTLGKEVVPRFYTALREQEFAYEGTLLGRAVEPERARLG
jgi:flavorubredoxin